MMANEEIFNDLVRFEISKKMLLLGNHGGRRVRKYRRTYIDNPWETVDQFDKQRAHTTIGTLMSRPSVTRIILCLVRRPRNDIVQAHSGIRYNDRTNSAKAFPALILPWSLLSSVISL